MRTSETSRRILLRGLVGGGVGLLVGSTRSSDPPQGAGGSTSTFSGLPTTSMTSTTAVSTTAPATTPTSVAPIPAPHFPATEWEIVSPTDAGWDLDALEAVVEFAFSRATEALVLVDDGRIVVERYGSGGDGYRRDIASCQKSVVSLLVGIAMEGSLVELDEPVSTHLSAGWSNAAVAEEGRITVRHLLSMTSGLDADLRAAAAPGDVWSYNNDAYHQLQPVLEAAAGQGIDALCAEWLWAPIGATASSWHERPGNGPNSLDAKGRRMWGLVMSARDMARFGLLVQRHGR